jgi:capsular exopolysaccharide synthesis family protein
MLRARDHHGPLILEGKLLDSPLAEAYRKLRSAVLARRTQPSIVTILVTSAQAGEGKTTTVGNLGIMLAQAGSRVLLVDADFRHPTLHLLAGDPHRNGRSGSGLGSSAPAGSDRGLVDVIRHGAELDHVIVPTRFGGVSLLPAGSDLQRPGDLFGSPRMAELITSLRQHADLVLIDSAPCIDHVDAIELAEQTDAVLYVIRAGDQDRAAQLQVEGQLRQSKAHLLGVVFNAF